MKRDIDLKEISDGRLYGRNDMVKVDCHGCGGCSDCCRGMGNSVILDPYDVYRLETGLGKGLAALMEEGKAELNVVDGCILPNLNMTGQDESCVFLDGQGRCSIHEFRPGVCRLFPLGRYYENNDFKYILQIHECSGRNRSKIKVGKWIDTPMQEKNHEFICRWHCLLNDVEAVTGDCEDEMCAKQVNMALLKIFYFRRYEQSFDFYEQFDARYQEIKDIMRQAGSGRATD